VEEEARSRARLGTAGFSGHCKSAIINRVSITPQVAIIEDQRLISVSNSAISAEGAEEAGKHHVPATTEPVSVDAEPEDEPTARRSVSPTARANVGQCPLL
jgi:hypothetical protein